MAGILNDAEIFLRRLTIPAFSLIISACRTDTLLHYRSAVRCPYIMINERTHHHGNDQSSHPIRLYGAAARPPDADGAPDGGAALVLRRVWLHPARHAHHRSERRAARQGRRRDGKADLPLLQGRQRPLAPLRPDGPPRQIRRAALCRPRLPVPPLPDRQGLPRRARAARALPRVLSGGYRRHRRRRAGHHERRRDPGDHLHRVLPPGALPLPDPHQQPPYLKRLLRDAGAFRQGGRHHAHRGQDRKDRRGHGARHFGR